METNNSVWKYYQEGFVDELYVPYLRKIVTDPRGNKVSINTWEKQGCPQLVDPDLVRKDWGLRFQRLFDTDPCPLGWTSGPDGYCFREPLKHERIFYGEKAFLPKIQFWDGYANGVSRPGPSPTVSEPTDMRSVNPLTGQYTIYYPGVDNTANVRYGKPIVNDDIQYDNRWSLPVRRKYAALPTKDSYLG